MFRLVRYTGEFGRLGQIYQSETVNAESIDRVDWAGAFGMNREDLDPFFRIIERDGVRYIDYGSWSDFVAIWEVA